MKIFFLIILLLFSCSHYKENPTVADENKITQDQIQKLKDLRNEIRAWAITDKSGIMAFEDGIGDSTLYAGWLCASGDQSQCDAVKNSFCPDGGFGRNPTNCDQEKNRASRDMLLGVLLYLTETKDVERANNLMKYIRTHNYKLCVGDDRCDLNPVQHAAAWATMRKIWNYIGADVVWQMYPGDVIDEAIIRFESVFSGIDYNTDQGGIYIDNDYELNLVTIELWLRQRVDAWSTHLDEALAEIIKRGKDKNAFVEFLTNGKTTKAADIVLSRCPTQKPGYMRDWLWKPGSFEKHRELHSCGWDCIGMINILIGAE